MPKVQGARPKTAKHLTPNPQSIRPKAHGPTSKASDLEGSTSATSRRNAAFVIPPCHFPLEPELYTLHSKAASQKAMGGVPREQTMLKRHLPDITKHTGVRSQFGQDLEGSTSATSRRHAAFVIPAVGVSGLGFGVQVVGCNDTRRMPPHHSGSLPLHISGFRVQGSGFTGRTEFGND